MNNAELNTLKTGLKNKDYKLRRDAIQKLSCSVRNQEKTIEKNPSFTQLIPILTEALTDSDGYTRVLAAEALVGIDRNFEQADAFKIMKTLIEILGSKEDELVDEEEDDIDCCYLTFSEGAGFVLLDTGGFASSVASEVIQLLTNPDPQYRGAVIYALSLMVYGNPTPFTEGLEHKNKLVRLGILDVFSELERYGYLYYEKDWVIPALEKASEDKNKQVRKEASMLLKSLVDVLDD